MSWHISYKIIKKIVVFVAAFAAFYGAVLGIYQYYENKYDYDLNGEWVMNLKIESTSYNSFKGLEIGYKIYLTQNQNTVTGNGEKWWQNGKELPFSQHDPIQMQGTIKNNQLVLSFTLKGSRRETYGIVNLSKTNSNELVGTFSTTGANSSGSVIAYKIPESN